MKANDLKRINIGEIYYRLNPHESKYPELENARNEHDWDILEASWNPDKKQWSMVIKANVEPDEEAVAETETKEEADD